MFVHSSDYLRGEVCVSMNVNVCVCEWQAVGNGIRMYVCDCTKVFCACGWFACAHFVSVCMCVCITGCVLIWTCIATWYSMQLVSCLSSTRMGIATGKIESLRSWKACMQMRQIYLFRLPNPPQLFLHCQPNHHIFFSLFLFLQPYFPPEQVLKWSWTYAEEKLRMLRKKQIFSAIHKSSCLAALQNKNAHQNLKASAGREDDFHLWSINGSVNRGCGCMWRDWQRNSHTTGSSYGPSARTSTQNTDMHLHTTA